MASQSAQHQQSTPSQWPKEGSLQTYDDHEFEVNDIVGIRRKRNKVFFLLQWTPTTVKNEELENFLDATIQGKPLRNYLWRSRPARQDGDTMCEWKPTWVPREDCNNCTELRVEYIRSFINRYNKAIEQEDSH